MHGFDDDTIGETTEPLGDIVRTARARSPLARFQVGPMTLGLRYNPNATTPEGRRRSASPDPRQSGMIAAAWLVATIAGYLDPSLETLTFFEPVGPKGLLANDGAWSPSAYALARLSPLANHPVSVLRWPDHPRAAGLLTEAAQEQILCVAHPRDEGLHLTLPSGSWRHAETLTPTGFIRAPIGQSASHPVSKLTVALFGVHGWSDRSADCAGDGYPIQPHEPPRGVRLAIRSNSASLRCSVC